MMVFHRSFNRHPVVVKAARGSLILNTRLEPHANVALHLIHHQLILT